MTESETPNFSFSRTYTWNFFLPDLLALCFARRAEGAFQADGRARRFHVGECSCVCSRENNEQRWPPS